MTPTPCVSIKKSLAVYVVSIILGLSTTIVSAYDVRSSNNNNNAQQSQQHWSLRNSVPAAEGSLLHHEDDLTTIVTELVSRMETLESQVKNQAKIIVELQSQLDDHQAAHNHNHRFLDGFTDADCLPEFVATSNGGRCDFKYVVRFQNNTIFNDYAFFNENVDFDSEANCMPLTLIDENNSLKCIMKDNFTFISDVEFLNTTAFKKDSNVVFEKEVIFKDPVKFQNDTKFEDDVHISNTHKKINFDVDGKVIIDFSPDYTIKFNKETTFYRDVKMKKDLRVDADFYVDGHAYLDGTTVDGDLEVKEDLTVRGHVTAKDGITSQDGIAIKYGKLDVQRDGIHVVGHSIFADDVVMKSNLEVLGDKVYSGDVTLKGLLTAEGGAIIWNGADVNDGPAPAPIHRQTARRLANGDALTVNGKTTINDILVVNGKATVGAMDIDGSAGSDPFLTVAGDGHFEGVVTFEGFNIVTPPPTVAPGRPAMQIDQVMIDEITVNVISKIQTETVVFGNAYLQVEDPMNRVLTLSTIEGETVEVGAIHAAQEVTVGGEAVITLSTAEGISSPNINVGGEASACSCPPGLTLEDLKSLTVEVTELRSKTGYKIEQIIDEERVWVDFGGGGGGGTCTCTENDVSDAVASAVNSAIADVGDLCTCTEAEVDAAVSRISDARMCSCPDGDAV